MAHLGILDRDASIPGHAVAKGRGAIGTELDILGMDLVGDRQVDRHLGIGPAGLAGHPRLNAVHRGQHHPQRLLPGGLIVPVQIHRRLEAGGGQLRHPGLGSHHRQPLRQPPPLLTHQHTQNLAEGVTQKVDRVLHPPGPHKGLESNATRTCRAARVPMSLAYNATVRSTSRRSSADPISRLRKLTSVALENGAVAWSMQSSTSCQRRSITLASTASASEAPL